MADWDHICLFTFWIKVDSLPLCAWSGEQSRKKSSTTHPAPFCGSNGYVNS